MARRISVFCMVFALLAGTASTSSAATPFQKEGSFEVSLQLGGLFFLDDEAVPYDTAGPFFQGTLKDTFTYTLAGSYNFTRMFAAELALSLSPAEVNELTIFSAHIDFVVHPITHDWFVPFFGVGPSFSVLDPQEAPPSDIDPGVNVVAGLKLFPWEHIGFRIDLRYLLRFATADDATVGSATFSEVTGHDLIFSAGLTVNFGGEEEIKEPVLLDTDGDGILDNVDACPTVPGVLSAKGCPDADADTITDADDRCPNAAGPIKDKGCPDGDGDTVVDIDDKCPTVPGVVALAGCPDGDGDRIVDADDRCPKIPGEAAYQGCPPPPPDDVVQKFSGTIQGITFEKNKDIIRESSFTILDEAYAVMAEYKQLNVLIEGHTSSDGDDEANLDLSKRRAASVKKYLVDKGIAPERLETKGFGETAPTTTNDTAAGRRQNRRIEFKLLRQ